MKLKIFLNARNKIKYINTFFRAAKLVCMSASFRAKTKT